MLPVEVTVSRKTSMPGDQAETGLTLKKVIELEWEESKWDWSRFFAEGLRFAIAFAVALADCCRAASSRSGNWIWFRLR